MQANEKKEFLTLIAELRNDIEETKKLIREAERLIRLLRGIIRNDGYAPVGRC